MADTAETVVQAVVDNSPLPPLVKQIIDLFLPTLVGWVEDLFGKSTSGAVDAAHQDLTNKKYQWVLDCITECIIPDLEKRCPSWVVPEIEQVKGYVLAEVTRLLNELPAS